MTPGRLSANCSRLSPRRGSALIHLTNISLLSSDPCQHRPPGGEPRRAISGMRVWGWEYLPTDRCGWSHGVGARGGAEVSEGDHTPRPSPAHLLLEIRAGPQAGPLAVDGCPEGPWWSAARVADADTLGARPRDSVCSSLRGPSSLSGPQRASVPPSTRPGGGPHAELPCRLPPPVPAPAHLTNFCPSLDLS